ncbi:XamI family restriction endonuclease [Saccharopolyspora spinosa]|uniref:XamI restriction endonuclease n=1 Tax=Saccharopolyspora spinosa TaxID=60894 RepID=A0A2N3XWF9_SACSN|nr:XamI family restriction endonuclease [Saccharopolyspora spinosa]PKW14989.1 XamI restriction endonuclease [Saccharopolyspora spinosa]
MPQVPPPRWSEDELTEDAAEAVRRFCEKRMQEPLEQYLEQFDSFRGTMEDLIEETIDLSELREQAAEQLSDPRVLYSVRYLAGPPISTDDLKELVGDGVSLAPTKIKSDPEMARRVVETVLLGLDRVRFPWVGEDREPTDAEREIAVIATAAMIATQRVQTARRNEAKDEQEDAVAEVLKQNGFIEVPTRVVENTSHFPGPGEFCRESEFGGRKADLIVGLWDGRVMPIECKVSNSSTNSVKRLNNDAAAKAETWIKVFGTATVVSTAVLSGVFKIHNLESAQSRGLTLFWAHRLDSLISFIEKTRP